MLNKWLARPSARLVQGWALSEKAIVVWVEFPEPQARESGDVIGIDVGISKLMATSDEQAWQGLAANLGAGPSPSPGKQRPRARRPRPLH